MFLAPRLRIFANILAKKRMVVNVINLLSRGLSRLSTGIDDNNLAFAATKRTSCRVNMLN